MNTFSEAAVYVIGLYLFLKNWSNLNTFHYVL